MPSGCWPSRTRPKLVALGMSMTLFPLPCREMADIIAPWGGRLFFDGAHQLGLIAGGQFRIPCARAPASSPVRRARPGAVPRAGSWPGTLRV